MHEQDDTNPTAQGNGKSAPIPSEVLKMARGYLVNPESRLKPISDFAQDEAGFPTLPDAPDAKRFCFLGALQRAELLMRAGCDVSEMCRIFLDASAWHGGELPDSSDQYIERYDRAIARAEARGQ